MILGIDVSEHNGILDWKEVREYGISFAMIRLGYGKGHLDSAFYRNVNGAIAAGLYIGIYYYSYALSVEEARAEARFTWQVLADCGLTAAKLPMECWLDMEDADGFKARHGADDSALVTSMCQAYVEEMNRAGYPCGIYGSYDWLTHRIRTEKLSPYLSYWCAQWGRKCDFPKASIWQYTDHLEVNGRTLDGNLLIRKNWEE